MKTKPTRETAWACLVSNQLVLPGLGTILAGRPVGYVQAAFSALAALGAGIFIVWALPRLGDMLNLPEDDEALLALFEAWRPWMMLGLGSIAVFLFTWCWAWCSSISILLASRSDPPSLNRATDE